MGPFRIVTPTAANRRPAVRGFLLLFVAAGTCGPPALPAAEPPRLEITPLVGYRFGGTFEITASDAALEIDEAPANGLILNWRESAKTQWELLYTRQTSRAETTDGGPAAAVPVDLDVRVLQLGGTYQGDGDTLRPYLAATIGGTRIETDADSDTFFSGSIGAGLMFRPTARVGLRVEARAYGTLTDSDTDLFCLLGGETNVCAVRVDGNVLAQVEVFAGVVLRF